MKKLRIDWWIRVGIGLLTWIAVVPRVDAQTLTPVVATAAAAPAAGETRPAGEAEDEFVDEYATVGTSAYDPFARVNRTMFKFNQSVYRYVLRPVARGYEKVVPAIARRGVRSFFDNLRFPVRLAGCVLQGEFNRAGAETGKFALNSTAGLAGFIRVSERFPRLRVPEEDIGQAFARWGLGHGPFLILPVLGPSSLRDGIGRIGDYYATPLNWEFVDDYDAWVEITLQAGDTLSALPGLLDRHDSLYRTAVDPYVAFRNAYLEFRDGEVKK